MRKLSFLGLALVLCLVAQASAQTNLSGTYRAGSLTWVLQRSGNLLTGTLNTPSHTHKLTAVPTASRTYQGIVERRERGSGRTTVMYVRIVPNGSSSFDYDTEGTDGRADLTKDFTEHHVFER